MKKDLIIVGAGPAGITAAVYAARKKLDFTVLSRDIGGQAAWAGEVENYTGYQYLSGPELAAKFREHLEKYKFDLREQVDVAKIERLSDCFGVTLSDGSQLEGRTVILASGKRPRLLNVPGEAKFKNKGVVFCATCDGPVFAGKNVAVIGGGNSGLDAALQLIMFCPKVYLINTADQLTGDPVMQEKATASPKVEVLNKAKMVEIFGDQFVKGIKVEVAGQARELAVEGVFVEIGLVPNSSMVDFVNKNEYGEIVVANDTSTSVPGLFAAGDVTNVPDKQIIIAAGEGAKACLAAFRYLMTHKC